MEPLLKRLDIGDGFDLEAAEEFVRELSRTNWKSDLDCIDLLPVVEKVQEIKRRCVDLESKLIGGLKKAGVRQKRFDSDDEHELKKAAEQAAEAHGEVSRATLYRLVTEFGHKWTISGSKFYQGGFKSPAHIEFDRTECVFYFKEPFQVPCATVDPRELLEALIQNSLQYTVEDLRTLLEQAIEISKTKPGPGKFNHRLRKKLMEYRQNRLKDLEHVYRQRDQPADIRLALAAWNLTSKGPATGLDHFPWVGSSNDPEPYPGSEGILLRFLTGRRVLFG